MTKLSGALSRVHKIAHNHIVRSQEISRADREILVHGKWLQPVVRGWYLLVRPDAPPGESSPWYANFWDFIRLYLQSLYDDSYCLSAENSLDLHLSATTIPQQIIAIAKKGNNTPLKLLFNTSLLTYKDPLNIPEDTVQIKGIRVMGLALAAHKNLCKSMHITLDKQLF